MPPTIRPQAVILDELLSALVRSGLVTDIAPISITRMFASGVSVTVAELYYSLYTLYRSFFLTMATGADLDIRGNDLGLPRHVGQAASGEVVYTREPTYSEDIVLLAPQHLQPVVEPGALAPTYSTVGDARLAPSGRSLSGPAPLTSTQTGVNDQLTLSIDGDTPQTVTLGTQTSGAAVAAAIQGAVRALMAVTPALQPGYDLFRADWNSTAVNAYALRSGTAGPASSVVVTVGPGNDGSAVLKLGVTQGGTEAPGMDSLSVPVVADVLGTGSNLSAEQLTLQQAPVGGVQSVRNPLPLVDGRDPASDDAYRQDVQAYLLALGRGTGDSIVRAAQSARLPNGTQPVQSAQAVPDGDAHVRVFVSDNRSRTLGAQPDVVQAVQDELDGRGAQVGGWVACGVTAKVEPARVRVTDVTASVIVGPTPDLAMAQRACVQAITQALLAAGVGETVGYVSMLRAIDQAVPDVLRVDFTRPAVFRVSPQQDLPRRGGRYPLTGDNCRGGTPWLSCWPSTAPRPARRPCWSTAAPASPVRRW